MELIVAAACGFLSGLGVGGGSLLMVWLTAVAAMPQQEARVINLLYFLPAAAVSIFFHSRNRCVDWRRSCWAILGGVLAAVAGILLSQQISTDLLRKGFGVLLLIVGTAELCKKG